MPSMKTPCPAPSLDHGILEALQTSLVNSFDPVALLTAWRARNSTLEHFYVTAKNFVITCIAEGLYIDHGIPAVAQLEWLSVLGANRSVVLKFDSDFIYENSLIA